MTLCEYTYGPQEKTRAFYSDPEDDEALSDILKRVRKFVKKLENDVESVPHGVVIRSDSETGVFIAEVLYAEF